MKTTIEIQKINWVNRKISLLKQLEEDNKELIEQLQIIAEQQQEIDSYKQTIDNYPK